MGKIIGLSNETGSETNHQCPLCNAPLLMDKKHVWCSRVGEQACPYGLITPVLLESLRDKTLVWKKYKKPKRLKPIRKSALTKGQRLIWRARIHEHLAQGFDVAGATQMVVAGGINEHEAQRLVRYIVAYHFKEKNK